MSPNRPLLALVCASLVTSLASAQSVELRGKVEDGEGACYYCPGFDYVIDIADFPITSSTFDLAPYMGLYIEAQGQWNGSFSTPVVELTALTVVGESFTLGGGGKVGDSLDFTAHGTPGDTAVLAASLKKSFLPVLATNDVLMLDPAAVVVLGSKTIGGGGEASIATPPLSASFVGLDVFGQGLIFPAGGAAPFFTNVDAKTIKP